MKKVWLIVSLALVSLASTRLMAKFEQEQMDMEAQLQQKIDGVLSKMLPPNSYLVVVYPTPATADERAEIAQAIWDRAPAGIRSADATGVLTTWTAVVTDVEGVAQTVRPHKRGVDY